MKYGYMGLAMVLFGLFGVVVILLFETITFDNDSEYYVLKESMEAAMIESVDLACYRSDVVDTDVTVEGDSYLYNGCGGTLKISEQKFVENFTRRFSQSISGNVDSYDIKFYDIIESPPKASVVITSNNRSYNAVVGDVGITNYLSGILEIDDGTENSVK